MLHGFDHHNFCVDCHDPLIESDRKRGDGYCGDCAFDHATPNGWFFKFETFLYEVVERERHGLGDN